MSELKAIRLRIAANWLIFGSFIIGLIACVVRLVLYLNNVVNFDRYVLPNGTKLPLPLDMILLIGIVLVLMLIGLIFLIASVRCAKAAERENEPPAAAEESESAYIEEDLPTEEENPAEEPAAEPTGEAEPEAPELNAVPVDRVCRRKKTCARKGTKTAMKVALVAVPVAIAVVATAVTTAALVRTTESRRHARNRRRFYDWLG